MKRKDGVLPLKTLHLASMRTRIYGGFGGWIITAKIREKSSYTYVPPADKEWREYPTLMKFELMARKHPGWDWRAELDLPLRSAVYQRQGKNKWVLVESGQGFA